MKFIITLLLATLLAAPAALAQYQPKGFVFGSSMTPLRARVSIPNAQSIDLEVNVDFRLGYVINPNITAGLSGRLYGSSVGQGGLVNLGVFGRYIHPLADEKSCVFGEAGLGFISLSRFSIGGGFNHFFTNRIAFETTARFMAGGRTETIATFGFDELKLRERRTSVELGIGLLFFLSKRTE